MPRSSSAAPVRRRAKRPAQPPVVVVATADAPLARMFAFALNQLGLRFTLCSSGTEILDRLLRMRVRAVPPLVLLDLDLPGMDGHAVLERLGVARPDAFLIIALSSHGDESVQVRSLMAGALDHLAKPFNIRVLMAKVQRWTSVSIRLANGGSC